MPKANAYKARIKCLPAFDVLASEKTKIAIMATNIRLINNAVPEANFLPALVFFSLIAKQAPKTHPIVKQNNNRFRNPPSSKSNTIKD